MVHDVIRLVRRAQAYAIDRVLGIDCETLPAKRLVRDGDFSDGTHYEGAAYALVRRYLEPLRLTPGDTAVDIGCGMGRIVCVCARRDIARAVGVEISPELAARAQENARGLRGRRAPIEIVAADATRADYGAGTAFIMFNPFGADTMARVLDRIRESVTANPRTIRMAYLFPKQEHVLAGCGWLHRYADRRSRFYRTTASYWTNDAAWAARFSSPAAPTVGAPMPAGSGQLSGA